MRPHLVSLALVALALLAARAPAEDRILLVNGGTLRGTVISESEEEVVIQVGAGKVTLPRSSITRIETGQEGQPVAVPVTRRDDWYLLLREEEVVGWRHLVHTRTPEKEQVEERFVILVPQKGGTTLDRRCVEIADQDGAPLEFLRMQSRGKQAEVISGKLKDGELLARVWKENRTFHKPVRLDEGWRLLLTRWVAFVSGAAKGQSATYRVLDPESLELVEARMTRLGEEGDPRWGEFELVVGERRIRARARPESGVEALVFEPEGLRALRVSRGRVELVQRALAPDETPTVEEAMRHPLQEREPDLVRYHARTGLALRLPDKHWTEERSPGPEGLVLSYENGPLLASLDIFVHPFADGASPVDECFQRERTRLELVTESLQPDGPVEKWTVAGLPARVQKFKAAHRAEDLGCVLVVVRAADRYVVLVGGAPSKLWSRTERYLGEILDSLEIAR